MSNSLYGILAQFPNPESLYHGCEKVRDAGFKYWDAHTPFPVHGLEKAMGLKASPLAWIVLCMALLGGSSIFLLQYWTSAIDYPLVISGKPLNSWPAFIPVTFEFTILFSALGCVFGMLGLNQLPKLFHPLFRIENFMKVTDDGFFISLEVKDKKFDPQIIEAWLKDIGAINIEWVTR